MKRFLALLLIAVCLLIGIVHTNNWWVRGSVKADPWPERTMQIRPIDFALALHGGAGVAPTKLSDDARADYQASLSAALSVGKQILEQGGASLQAVELVIRQLEDDPKFNAGRGAVLNHTGSHELDAAIMDGRTRACGAVAGVTTAKNPITLATFVMNKTPHVLLAGIGADQFATEAGVDRVPQDYFRTEQRVREWKAARELTKLSDKPDKPYLGTVGCVALDRHGNLAAGTSTGGRTNKRFGRVGDSPIIGAGTFADNETCAVSCSGVGEQFIRNAVAYDVSALMAYRGMLLEEAVQHVLQGRLSPGDGGIIAVDRDGTIVMATNTAGMCRAAADSTGRFEVAVGK